MWITVLLLKSSDSRSVLGWAKKVFMSLVFLPEMKELSLRETTSRL